MSTSNKNAGTEVVSLDALIQQKRDALPADVAYEALGVTFTLPPMRKLPWSLQEKVGNLNDTFAVLQETLGEEKVKEMYDAGFQLGDLEVIALDWQKRAGMQPGESKASAAS
ncbi:hypothetical protein [Streptomyces sp. GbtcB6]|uniref:hypothetical protein n=1 Tax=Streptomyces sp. GbtcB6 TaxID=2824751 RepID=UPI001C30AA56|nr:hypothetical protein [Streptomyces sp. GbtcB6]